MWEVDGRGKGPGFEKGSTTRLYLGFEEGTLQGIAVTKQSGLHS